MKVWKRTKNYHKSDIIGDFVLTHEKYCHPRIVLTDDNMTISGCDNENVWFMYTPPEV